MADISPIWAPSPERIASANLTSFMAAVSARWSRPLADYAALHRWSIDCPAEFWRSIWEFGEVRGEPGEIVVMG
jgi:acetoacetyl-CoA synthetase